MENFHLLPFQYASLVLTLRLIFKILRHSKILKCITKCQRKSNYIVNIVWILMIYSNNLKVINSHLVYILREDHIPKAKTSLLGMPSPTKKCKVGSLSWGWPSPLLPTDSPYVSPLVLFHQLWCSPLRPWCSHQGLSSYRSLLPASLHFICFVKLSTVRINLYVSVPTLTLSIPAKEHILWDSSHICSTLYCILR